SSHPQPARARLDHCLARSGIKILRDARALQMSLFDERDMAAITSPDFPGERLMFSRNQAWAAERPRRREDLLAATERELARIAAAVARQRQPLRGACPIGLKVGAVLASATSLSVSW